jgi:glutamate decarboxylase
LAARDEFEVIGDGGQLPVVAVALKPGFDRFNVFDISDALRKRGWQVPAYTFPQNLENTAVLRIVVRNGFGRDLADNLLSDLAAELDQLHRVGHPPIGQYDGFHH